MVQDQNGTSHHGQKPPAASQEMELFFSGPRWGRQAEEKKSVLGHSGQGPGKATGGWQVFYVHGWGQMMANDVVWSMFDWKFINYPFQEELVGLQAIL
jgi:hypothetical protein